jgi:hypothetical protein
LKLPGMISSRLFSATPKIQDIFHLWGAEYWGTNFRRVPVDVEVRRGRSEPASGVACFFSGGVDSFYTLLKYRDEVTHLIFVHGFDIPLAERGLRAQTSRMAREVARELGKDLIEVETNLRAFSDTLVDWDKYHGAALASIALLFQHRFRKVLISSNWSYADLFPWGTHPLLDPLWSTELTEIEHDGCETTRPEKVADISAHELPMEWLRVCLKNSNGAYNCGRCKKCLLTMVSLRAAGALERCKTLPSYLDPAVIANTDMSRTNVVLSDDTVGPSAWQNLKILERFGTEPELHQALAEAISTSLKTGEARAANTEARAAHKERERLQRQLHRSHEQLKRTRTRLAALTTRYSSRRYKLADALAESALRIPGMEKLVRRMSSLTD